MHFKFKGFMWRLAGGFWSQKLRLLIKIGVNIKINIECGQFKIHMVHVPFFEVNNS